MELESLEHVLGHRFARPGLLQTALTHASLGYEAQRSQADNQRLEFLGDAVLQLALSEMLYERFSEADEGFLTQLRAQVVSAKALAQVARRLQLGAFLRMGRGEEAHGGRDRESTLADAFEAIAGAIYLDGGMPAAQTFVQRHFSEDVQHLGGAPSDHNPKGQLQERIQALGNTPPSYQILNESGPDHAKSFEATVLWHGTVLGHGKGRSKKDAETEAARNALAAPGLTEQLKQLSVANHQAPTVAGKRCEQADQEAPVR